MSQKAHCWAVSPQCARRPTSQKARCWAVSPQCVQHNVRRSDARLDKACRPRGQDSCKLESLEQNIKMAYNKSGIQQLVKIPPGKEFHNHHDNSERPSHMFGCVHGFDITCALLRKLSREMHPRGGARISNICKDTHSPNVCREIWAPNPHLHVCMFCVMTMSPNTMFGSNCLNQR